MEQPAAESNGGASAKTPGRKFPLTLYRALPHREILGMDEEIRQSGVWMVPIQGTDEGTLLKEYRLAMRIEMNDRSSISLNAV